MCFNVFMILIRNEFTAIPKEVYFGRFFSNLWWLSLCVSFSKSRWVSSKSRGRNNGSTNINVNPYEDTNRSGSGMNSNSSNKMEAYGYTDVNPGSSSSSGGFNSGSFYDRDNPRYTADHVSNESNDTY